MDQRPTARPERAAQDERPPRGRVPPGRGRPPEQQQNGQPRDGPDGQPVRPWQQPPRTQSPQDQPTRFIPSERGVPRGAHWPAADPDAQRPYQEIATRMMPRVREAPTPAEPIGHRLPPIGTDQETRQQAAVSAEPAKESVAKASGRMAIATLVSRITGFAWKVMLAWVAGISVVYDSFTVANTLPLVVNELLLGGVLTTVVVPMLVRSQDDKDGGLGFTQQLVTMAASVLVVGTLLATAGAPLLVSLFMEKSASPDLATAFAYLLLPGLLCYGMFAVLSAILNAKQYFGPAQWAPVVNNVVIFVAIGLYTIVPGDPTVNPLEMSDPKLLVLGGGVLTAMTSQALYLIRPLRRSGFRFRFRWGLDSRLKEFGGLAAWVLGYVGLTQLGVMFNMRVLTGAASGSAATYTNAWLLFQLPYGVIGVSLLTALLPRMSRSAADSNYTKLVADLSYGSRLTTLILLPISAIMTVAGPSIGVALFAFGQASVDSAAQLGMALAMCSFGLVPFALVMLQMRVFYSMKDARGPTLIMAVMIVIKIPLLYLASALLDDDNVVLGVMLTEALVYTVGAILGQVWLWVKLGSLRSRRVVGVILFTVVASALGAFAAYLTGTLVPDSLGGPAGAWVRLVLEGIVGIGVSFGLLIALRVDELAPITQRVSGILRRSN